MEQVHQHSTESWFVSDLRVCVCECVCRGKMVGVGGCVEGVMAQKEKKMILKVYSLHPIGKA